MANTISVIIPIYNDEKYIAGCVKSVLKQTYSDFEVILIDDGSEDRSCEICEKVCKKDKRFRLIVQEHRGVSAARNKGMDESSGKYLFFLDSDDLIHPQLLETLCILQEKQHTMLATVGLYTAQEGKFRKPAEWKYEDIETLETSCLKNEDAKKHRFFMHSRTMLYAIGGKMILRTAVGSLRFDERLTHGEDTRFLYQLLMNGADVSVLFRNWYYYRSVQNSSNRMYTVDMCKSKYKAVAYIRDKQIEDGMASDADCMEWKILGALIEWNEGGKKAKDIRLMKYMRDLIENEKKLRIFSRVSWCGKILFYLGCEHYPIYSRIEKGLQVYYNVSNKCKTLMKRDFLVSPLSGK